MTSFIECVMKNIDDAADFLKLSPSVIAAIKTPMKELTVTIPVRMDNGEIKRFIGFRIHHNNALGYTKGGIRFYPNETIDTVRSLASLMTWKCSLAGLPLGGAKGGVIVDPRGLSVGELERLSRGYIRSIIDVIGNDIDVCAPDVGTTPQIMSWMMDEFEQIKGKSNPAIITGKPIALGGSLGRDKATALGGIFVLSKSTIITNKNIAIQGFGNVGSYAAKILHNRGANIVAIGDISGAVYSSFGINPYEYEGQIKDWPRTKLCDITNKELLELDVDILIPAALENVITKDNANNIKAGIILELANGPTTPEADEILYNKHIKVIPDILANAGGVIVSHFESIQNTYHNYWKESEVDQLLKERIVENYEKVARWAKHKKISMRKAAYIIAILRVVEAMKLRGAI